MSTRELNAAGITDPDLRESYARCRELLARHGRTYYLATLLLPPAKRPYIQALYGFARYADELADRPDRDAGQRAEALLSWTERFLADLRAGHSDDPICRALVHTAQTWKIPDEHFETFVAAMRADLTVTEYTSYRDLEVYMYGAAGTIAVEMVPILVSHADPHGDETYAPMRAMGLAFQLTNILRDVAEDLDRGRLYLPLEDLSRFGLTRADLERRRTTAAIRELLRFEITRARLLYRQAEPAVVLLPPATRECVRVALILYSEILDAIEAAGHDVMARRARVGTRRRLQVAVPALTRSLLARRRAPS